MHQDALTVARDTLTIFAGLPGTTSYDVRVDRDDPPFAERHAADAPLFCASAFKVFVLAAYLRQTEARILAHHSGDHSYWPAFHQALSHPLPITKDDWRQSSAVFGELTGAARVTCLLDAMLAYSDNTATDLMMAHTGVANIRSFIADVAQLPDVRIPDSTQAFEAYIQAGRPFLNDQETMVCSTGSFTRFYAAALRRDYFQADQTLRVFKRALAQSSNSPLFVPADAMCYAKGGSANAEDGSFYAMSIAGKLMAPSDACFSLIYNWSIDDFPKAGGVEQAFLEGQTLFATTVQTVLESLQRGLA